MLTALALAACDPADDAEDLGDDGAAGSEDGEFDGDGGADGSDDGSSDALSFGGDVAPILSASCSCHLAGAGGLAFDGDAYGAMVGVRATGADLDYVVPGDVEGSYLVHKLRGTQDSVGGAGGPMPIGDPLDEAEILIIEDWIAAGAPE